MTPAERYVNEGPKNWELFFQHVGRYLFAKPYAAGRVVLDAACGTGYGTAMLAEQAKLVVGIDSCREAITYSIRHHSRPNVRYLPMNCGELGLRANSFDTVMSFETIEHLHDMKSFLQEVRRVLKSAGTLLISTPNRPLYTVYNKGKRNTCHYMELDEKEFCTLLGEYFTVETIWGQRHFASKDLPLVQPFADHTVPTGPDELIRRVLRVALRTCFSESMRSRALVAAQIWANKCSIGEVPPSHGVYMIALAKKRMS